MLPESKLHIKQIANRVSCLLSAVCLQKGHIPVLLAASGGKRSETGHEEMQPGEGDHVDRKLPEVSVQLTREPQTGGDTRHG